MNIEKGDVDISRLFHWGKEFEIIDRFGKKIMDVYLRLVGDAELNRSRVFAIRKSSELRKKLKNKDSEERLVYIQDISDDKDRLIDMITVLRIRDFTQEANKEIMLSLPKEPKSDSPLEEIEKYQQEVDTYSEKRMEQVQEYVQNKLKELGEGLKKESLEWLTNEYERILINELCEQEMIRKFRESCAYLGAFRDENYKFRLFESFDDFDNLPTEVKEQFLNHYSGLEINIDELKKSLEVTP